jgi:hypothetical protein
MAEIASKQITRVAEERGISRDEAKSAIIRGEITFPPRPRPVLVPQTFDQLVIFANMAANSGMVPKDYVGNPEAVMVAVQMGSELGLSPMQSLRNIACINGRPSVWGDALPGLCRQSGQCKDIVEWMEGIGDDMTAYCRATRVGCEPITQTFSVADAKRAGLWKDTPKTTKHGKNGSYEVDSGPWYSYPKRMLQMRARGFALRDAFPDVLGGLISAEEARDIPTDNFRGTTLDAKPERAVDTGAAIGDEIPDHPKPKGRTARQYLDSLHATLAACHTEWEVDAVVQSEDVTKAVATFTGLPLTELNALLAEALERVREQEGRADEPVEDDGFPGDKP